MFDLFIFFRPPCAGEAEQEQEREVSEDKVTYPLDEEGDNLNSYSENREYTRSKRIAERWDITVSQRRKSWNKVSGASERNKTGKI